MREQTTIEKILSIGFLVAIFGICITLLFLSFNSRQQRAELQKSSDKILCVLLVNHEDRDKETIKECDK